MKTTILTLALIISGVLLQAQKVQLISALGTDSTIYSNLGFDESFGINHIEWLKPQKRESMEAYCQRLINENQITPNDIVIGTSFGGIVATEISKMVHPRMTILISSFSIKDEKPLKFRFLQIFGCHKILPKYIFNKPGIIIGNCFGKVSEEEREYLSEMIRKNDVDLVAWSINQIMKYDNQSTPDNLFKINGKDDKTFPAKNIDTDFLVDGTHLIVYNNADLISSILHDLMIDSVNSLVLEK